MVLAQPAGVFNAAGLEVAGLRILEAQGGWHETTTLVLDDTTHQSVVNDASAELHLATAGEWLFVSTPRGAYDGVQLYHNTNAGWRQANSIELSPKQGRCIQACSLIADEYKLIVKLDYNADGLPKESEVVFRCGESGAWVESQRLNLDNRDQSSDNVTALAMGGSTVVMSHSTSNIAAEKAGALRVFTEAGDGTISPASTGKHRHAPARTTGRTPTHPQVRQRGTWRPTTPRWALRTSGRGSRSTVVRSYFRSAKGLTLTCSTARRGAAPRALSSRRSTRRLRRQSKCV